MIKRTIFVSIVCLSIPNFLLSYDFKKTNKEKKEGHTCIKYASRYIELNEKIETQRSFDEKQNILQCNSSDGSTKSHFYTTTYHFIKEKLEKGRTYVIRKKQLESSGFRIEEAFHYNSDGLFIKSVAEFIFNEEIIKIYLTNHQWDEKGRETAGTVSAVINECPSLPITYKYDDQANSLEANYGFDLEGLSDKCREFTMKTKQTFDSDFIIIHDVTIIGKNPPKEKKFQILERDEVCAKPE